MLHAGEEANDMEKPDRVRALLAPGCKAEDIRIERTAVYRFHAREARRFSKGRCFLVGDAAHVTPPFAGQGLVAGLRATAHLAWKIAGVVRGQLNEQVLDSYDQERRPHARKIINLARFLGKLVMPRNRLAAFAIHGTMRAIRLLPAGRAAFDDLKIKPPQLFDRGLFWRDRTARNGLCGFHVSTMLDPYRQAHRARAERRCFRTAVVADRLRCGSPRAPRPRATRPVEQSGRNDLAVVSGRRTTCDIKRTAPCGDG